MPDLSAICELCGETVDARTVFDHFGDVHGLSSADWQLETWPDGEAVVIDTTLEPHHFDSPEAP